MKFKNSRNKARRNKKRLALLVNIDDNGVFLITKKAAICLTDGSIATFSRECNGFIKGLESTKQKKVFCLKG